MRWQDKVLWWRRRRVIYPEWLEYQPIPDGTAATWTVHHDAATWNHQPKPRKLPNATPDLGKGGQDRLRNDPTHF